MQVEDSKSKERLGSLLCQCLPHGRKESSFIGSIEVPWASREIKSTITLLISKQHERESMGARKIGQHTALVKN